MADQRTLAGKFFGKKLRALNEREVILLHSSLSFSHYHWARYFIANSNAFDFNDIFKTISFDIRSYLVVTSVTTDRIDTVDLTLNFISTPFQVLWIEMWLFCGLCPFCVRV